MVWVKYRHKEAAGPGPWEWEHWSFYSLTTAAENKDLIEENLISRYQYEGGYICEDYYRGVEIEFHKTAPAEIVINRLRYLYSKRDSIESEIKSLEGL